MWLGVSLARLQSATTRRFAHVSHVSAGPAHATAQANRGKPARHCEAHSPAGERHGGRASGGDKVMSRPTILARIGMGIFHRLPHNPVWDSRAFYGPKIGSRGS